MSVLQYTSAQHLACPSSLSTLHPQQLDRIFSFLHTSFLCARYYHQKRLWQAEAATPYGESANEMQWQSFHQHLQRSPCGRELEGQAGWRMQDWSQSNYSDPSNAELLLTLKSFWAAGNLPPVNLKNSGKLLNHRGESCRFSARFAAVPWIYSFLLKTQFNK